MCVNTGVLVLSHRLPSSSVCNQAGLSCSNMWFVFVYVFVLVHKCSTCVAFTAAEGASHMPRFHTLGHLFYPLSQHYSTWKFHLSVPMRVFLVPCVNTGSRLPVKTEVTHAHATPAPRPFHFTCLWGKTVSALGCKGLVDQALYSRSDQAFKIRIYLSEKQWTRLGGKDKAIGRNRRLAVKRMVADSTA